MRFDGRTIQFKDALGYGDHNWGIRFPREWIWLQSNAFPDGKTALALSGGTAPMGETEIDAHLIGLLHDGELHTFRVQDFDAISAEASKGWWEITGEGRHGLKRITVSAVCDIESLFHLLVATSDGMKPHAWESLVGTVTVVLERRASTADGWHVVFQGTSKHAGVELGE